jgi:hypothetical protein
MAHDGTTFGGRGGGSQVYRQVGVGQGGKPSVSPSWGWPSMMLGNDVTTFEMTMVRVGDVRPLDADDGSFRPSKKGQPNGASHSKKEHE